MVYQGERCITILYHAMQCHTIPQPRSQQPREAEKRDPGNEVDHTFGGQHSQLQIRAAHDGGVGCIKYRRI